MASFIDQALSTWKDIKVAQAQNPRVVQTIEQRQVETRQQVGGTSTQPNANTASSPASGMSGFAAKIPGGMKTLYIGGGLVASFFVLKKLKVI